MGAPGMLMVLWCTASGCDGEGPADLPPASLPELFGGQLYRADGSTVGVESLGNVPVIGIYFASSGCPACGGFTPLLVEAYNQLKEDGRSFEVVLVSPGIADATLLQYMGEAAMPWLAVPSESSRPMALVKRYDVRWIPTLLVIDEEANILSLTGRDEVVQKGAGAYDDWITGS